MKLLIFIHSLNTGGAERVTASLANHWAEKGWQITVLTLTSSAQDFYQLHPAVHRVALDVAGDSGNALAAMRNNLRRVRALRHVLTQCQPDVALAMMSTANILLALAAMGLKGMTVIGSEHTYPPRIPLGRTWEPMRTYLYGHLHAMVALTEESAAWLRQHTRARHIPVIPNAVSWPLPNQKPYLPLPRNANGQYTLLAVGRMSEEKGFHLLIRAFQRLAHDFPDWKLVILGDGPDRSALAAQIASAGLDERISLPGRAGNVGQWYTAVDLYVMSSRFEGFPNTLVEAMAHGLPAVSFDCDTGPRDIIRHEVDGLLVPAGDDAALENSLRHLMANAALRKKLGERAKEVRQRFSMRLIAEAWELLFANLKRE
ncbi:MAG: glycosyltransferase family 4 protein [Pseudomonadota bacterium]|nr:glycosyltransferase family 4 protein [Pseudomonadota bacterium]